MTEDDKPQFATVIFGLAELLNGKVTATGVEMYFRALERFSIAQVQAAADQILLTAKFFPKPVEIIEAIQGKPDDLAEIAWTKFIDAVRKGGQMKSVFCDDPTLLRTVQLLYGSWIKACEELPPVTHPMHANHRTQFLAIYTNCTDGIQYLKGLREATGMAPAQAFGQLANNETFKQAIVHIGETVRLREMEFNSMTGALTERSIRQLQPATNLRLLAA